MRTTVSVIKADVGSMTGHHRPHSKMMELAAAKLTEAEQTGLINSGYATHCGDDIILVMSHFK
ncbi:MAG: fructose 1,6-bisphosphatase, partial [Candidatus Caldarchaeum sp.]